MNEKLLELAKEKAVDIHVYEGEYAHHETEYTFSESGIVALLELVASTVHDNWQLVPIQPTDEMIAQLTHEWVPVGACSMYENYSAMLKAKCAESDNEK